MHGWLVLDKPVGLSSAKAVAQVKRAFNAQKAGHGGTLDPLASGVLPIALGEATKTAAYLLDADKHYTFTITFGEQRTTDDAEGEVLHHSTQRPTLAQLQEVLKGFMGSQQQVPPDFSAIKVNGKAAYASKRQGQAVQLAPRMVTVHRLGLEDFTSHTATLSLHGSKGIYVRALARDIGQKLGCYGYVSALRRTQAGRFKLQQAITQEKLDFCVQQGHSPIAFLLEPATVLDDIPAYRASVSEVQYLHAGRQLVWPQQPVGTLCVLNPQGQLVSLVCIEPGGKVNVLRNLNI